MMSLQQMYSQPMPNYNYAGNINGDHYNMIQQQPMPMFPQAASQLYTREAPLGAMSLQQTFGREPQSYWSPLNYGQMPGQMNMMQTPQ
jgi:hypothetical protein